MMNASSAFIQFGGDLKGEGYDAQFEGVQEKAPDRILRFARGFNTRHGYRTDAPTCWYRRSFAVVPMDTL